jgi:hypothetical protein
MIKISTIVHDRRNGMLSQLDVSLRDADAVERVGCEDLASLNGVPPTTQPPLRSRDSS